MSSPGRGGPGRAAQGEEATAEQPRAFRPRASNPRPGGPGRVPTSYSVSRFHRTFPGSFSAETPVSGGCFVFSDPFLSVKGTGFSRLEPW